MEDLIETMQKEVLEGVVVPMAMEGELEVAGVIPEGHQGTILLTRAAVEVVHSTVHFKIYFTMRDITVAMATLL